MKKSSLEMRESLPVDIFTNPDNFQIYKNKIQELIGNMESEESYKKMLQSWRSRFMNRRMPPQEIL